MEINGINNHKTIIFSASIIAILFNNNRLQLKFKGEILSLLQSKDNSWESKPNLKIQLLINDRILIIFRLGRSY